MRKHTAGRLPEAGEPLTLLECYHCCTNSSSLLCPCKGGSSKLHCNAFEKRLRKARRAAHQAQQQLELQATPPALLAAALQDVGLSNVSAVPLLLNPLAVQQPVQWPAAGLDVNPAAGAGTWLGLGTGEQQEQQQQLQLQHQGLVAAAAAAVPDQATASATAAFECSTGGWSAGMQHAVAGAVGPPVQQQWTAVGAVAVGLAELQQQEVSKAAAAAAGATLWQPEQQQTGELLAQGSSVAAQQQQQQQHGLLLQGPTMMNMMEWQQQELQLQSPDASTSTELISFSGSCDSQVWAPLLLLLLLLFHSRILIVYLHATCVDVIYL